MEVETEDVHSSWARILAFRGSVTAQDWLTDAEFRRTAVGGGEEIHHGFLDAIISANEWLKAIAACCKDPRPDALIPPVYVTGHSLGGAMAVLAARTLVQLGVQVMGVYTFGGPRVGNGTWARNYDATETGADFGHPLRVRTWRVVNEEDIVPRIPGVLIGYRHAGREVFLPAYTHATALAAGGAVAAVNRIAPDFIIDPPLWTKLKSDALGTWRELRRGRCAQLEDHPIESYQGRLVGSIEPQIGERVETTH